jgi:hypothetical protein
VVEVVEEVVGEELLGGVKLAVGWGNNQSGQSPVRHSRRKMMTGKCRGPAFDAAGKVLV